MSRRILLLFALFAISSLPSIAQEHPNVAKGFAPDKVFAVGDVDSVNAFNGNLLLTIPIGARYPIREGFSYGLSAVYNSNVWDLRDTSSGLQSFTQARISRRSNVGAGWRLSLGQLYSPAVKADLPFNNTPNWLYVGPDAAEHRFFPTLHYGDPEDAGDTQKVQKTLYSRDGSYLRLKINADGTHTVEFPDGQVHVFNSNRQLIQIRDRFVQGGLPANKLDISYTATTWTLKDSHDRTQVLTFSNLTQDGLPIQRLDRVEFTAFGGTTSTSTWTFQYTTATIPRACPDCAGNPSDDPATSTNLTVHFLTGITQPDGSVWSIPLSDYILVNTPGFNDLIGRIQGLKLPTLGRLEWEYGFYRFPSESAPERGPWLTASRGVVVRKKKTASGGVEGTWTYTPDLLVEGPGQQTKQLLVTVTTPLGDKTENYFSVYAGPSSPVDLIPTILDYGKPYTPKMPDGGGRYLSTRVFDCLPNGTACAPVRSTWVRYEADSSVAADITLDGAGAGQLLNPRMAQMRTAFEDDCPPGVTDCGVTTPIPAPATRYYSDEDYSNFDGLGHYRTRQLKGNFPDTTTITETTLYNPARGTYGTPGFSMLPSGDPWLLGLYTDMTRSNNSGENSTVESCFDGSTGFLKRKRVRKFGRTADDVLVVYTPNSNGTVGREDWYGGDGGNVPTTELCGLTPPGADYSIQHSFQLGILSKSEYLKAGGTAFEFAVVDRTVDLRTGLISAERDISQLQTTYEYDNLGRLTWVQPAQGHGAWTEYLYTRATGPSSLAKVTIHQHANGAKGNPILTTKSLFFDSFGRLIQEQRKMPGGSFSNRTSTYDAIGNRATVSEWESGVPSNATKYQDYDPFGRPRTIQPSDGAAHAVTISRSGVRVVTKRTKIWGPCGTGGALQECSSDTVELYDQVGRLFRIDQPVAWPTMMVPNPAPLRTSYAYDIGDRLMTVKQFDPVAFPLGVLQQRDFAYDNRGFLNSEKHPEKGGMSGGGLVTYSNYDARGHAGNKVDGPSDLTFTYDRAERLTRIRETAGGTFTACGAAGPRCLKEYTFGTFNTGSDLRLGKVQVAKRYNYLSTGPAPNTMTIAETYTYAGKDGRASKRDTQVFADTIAREAFTQSFTYDDLGNTASLAYPQCTHTGCAPEAASPKTVTFAYTKGLLTAAPGYASAITYHSNQTISQVAHSNGITDVIGIDPNAQQRPASILARNAAGTNLWNAGTYAYDGTGNVKSIGGSGFAYDPASRLITANLWNGTGATGTPLKTQSYVYDLFGNLQNITGDGGRTTPTNSATNRLSGPGMFYDAAGNQTNSPGTIYEYDPFHLMWRFQSGAEDWRYVYTADDERIAALKTGGPTRWTLRGLDNNVLREYTHTGTTWTATEDFIHRGGQLLAAETAPGVVSHFHLDHLGTPRLITNQSGVKTAYHVYWPYGEELTSPAQDSERMKFTGHERDLNGAGGVGDDLDYMHARFCSPVTGRFLGVDAVGGSPGVPQSWNRYAYSLGNPIKYLDPDGEDEVAALSKAYTAAASAIISVGSKIQEVGDNLNQGGAAGIAVDTALGTAGSIVQGFGDLFNIGTSTGEAIGSGGDSYDVGNALAADLGRAGGIVLTLAGPASGVGTKTPLFRAVTPAESASLAETGAFSASPTGSMAKGFFFKAGDAESFAAKITTRTGESHKVVSAEAPTRLVKSSPSHSAAGEGPGVYIPNSQLGSVKLKARPK